MNQLNKLSIEKTRITTLPVDIKTLSKLETLYLMFNNMTNIDYISSLSSLKYLYIIDNTLANIPSEIGQLSNLEILIIYQLKYLN